MAAATGLRKYALSAFALSAVTLAGLAGIFTFATVIPVETTLSAQGFGPVLKLPPASYDLPFAADAARDPEIARHEPQDDTDAMRLAEEIKQMRDDLVHSQGPRALELHEQAYQNYAALAYYLEDVAAGRLNPAADRGKAQSQLTAIRGYLVQHAQYVAKAGDARQKAKALYQLYATQYAAGQESQAVAGLDKLEKNPAAGAVKKRAALLTALYEIDHGSSSARAKAVQTLKSAAGSLPARAQVAVRLSLAKSLAGLNKSGRKTAAANPAYRGQLAAATQKAASLSAADKDLTLAYAVSVWRAAEGSKIAWSKPPFRMGPYADSMAVKAIIERAAIEDWAANRKPQAIRKYQGLAKSLNGTPARADVDLRVLDLRRAEFAQSKNPKAYEAALVAANKTYLDPGVLGGGNEAKAKAVQAEIGRRHHVLVYGELARANTKAASPGDRKHAIAMASTYLSTLTDAKEIEDVKAKVAGVYALAGQHREAVSLYKELAETSNSGKNRQYWALAVRSQSVLAAWSEQAPWHGYKAGNPAEREELLLLYKKLGEQPNGKTAWFIAAQIGLLDLSLGKTDEAFTLWQTQLKQDASGPHAANAAGTMLVAYQKANAWDNLEALSRLCLTQRVAAVYRGTPVASHDMLGLALLEGGKQAMADSKFDVAVAKLKEFTANHQTMKRHDEGFFLLSVAYRGAGRHDDSIKTLLAFVDRYPKSGFNRQALLNGGDWAAPMAYEENVIFFYNRFVKQYAADAEAPRVRDALTALYLGRGRYAEAVAILNQTARASNDPAVKAQALAQVMDIEERAGSPARALAAADQLIRSPAVADETRASALTLKARFASSGGRFRDVKAIEGQLAALQSAAGQEGLGEVRYLLAVAQAKTVVKQYFNLALTDPTQTIAQRYTAFKSARAAYRNVCAAGQTSFCAPAMLKLSELSLDFTKSLDDINVQDTLAKEQVSKFQNFKQSVMNDAAATSQNSDGKALAAVSEGNSDPDWTQAVLWQNTSDWNLDRVSGETGNGYVQWTAGETAGAE